LARRSHASSSTPLYYEGGLQSTPSPIARRLWWHVLGVGDGHYRQRARWGPFLHAGMALVWVESGTGTLEIGGSRWHLERGNKFWVFDFEKPRTFIPSGPLVVRSIIIGGPGLHAWLDELGGTPHAQFEFDAKGAARVRTFYARLQRLVERKPRDWEWQSHLMITRLWEEFLSNRNLLATDPAAPPEPIVRALAALAAEPFRDWQAYELAAVARLSYWPFRRLFRQHMQETVHDHLQRRRADAAKILLADPRLQIKAIAQQLHFTSGRYFSYFFRSRAGVSPTQFREQLRGNGEASAPRKSARNIKSV
jgi:AraC-like DNA-binding protein